MNCDPSGRSAGTLADAEGACAISIELDEATTGPIVEAGIRIFNTARIMSVLLSGIAALVVVVVIDAILDSGAVTSLDDLNSKIRDRILSNAMTMAVTTTLAIPFTDATTDDNDKKSGPYTVYVLMEGMKVMYVGRTINYPATVARHAANEFRTGLIPQVKDSGVNYSIARGLEQTYILEYSTLNRDKEKPIQNQINGINILNTEKYNNYMKAAAMYLTDESITYVG